MTSPSPDLPAGPATATAVAGRLGGVDEADVVDVVAAVNAMCIRRFGLRPLDGAVVDDVAGVVVSWGEWYADHVTGANMLAVRLYNRRNSPAGVATFGAEGAAYVQRNDPDVAMLLGIGSYAPPRVG